MELKRISPLPFAKVSALLGAIMGLIFGLIIFSLSKLIANSQTPELASIAFANASAMVIITLPIFYGIFGFLFGLISAVLYNLVAKWVGGINLEFSKK
tara:strand:+ start:510 stop:803 length:294 start_codon:yes stop_codon:yes gene_type:complete